MQFADIGSEQRLNLNALEESFGNMLPAISTITFYNGKAPIDFLRERVASVVQANPWLISQQENGIRGKPELKVTNVMDHAKACCNEVMISALHAGMHPSKLVPLLSPFLVKQGKWNIYRGELPFRVTIVRTDSTTFALVVSMSHMLGDGHTFYQVSGMLSCDRTVHALDPHRHPDCDKACLRQYLGAKKYEGQMSISSLLGNFVLPRLNPCARPPVLDVHLINVGWVALQKKEHAIDHADSLVPFVSTNDVLTSWLSRLLRRSGGITMAINLRSRLRNLGLKDTHAGNYEAGCHLFTDESATPALVRKCVMNGMRGGREKYPSIGVRLRGSHTLVTNWASLHQGIDLPDCKTGMHMPLLHWQQKVSVPTLSATFIIFQASKDQLGIYTIAPPKTAAYIKQAGALSSALCSWTLR